MKIARLLPLFLIFIISCKRQDSVSQSLPFTAFTGATIIDGNGGIPIPNGVLLIRGTRVVKVGSKENVNIPEGTHLINVSGKTIIPGLINGHGHVGDVKGIEGGHYSKQNVIDNLSIYARYGITTVVSLGGDKKEAESLRSVNDTASTGRARLFIAGEIVNGKTATEALKIIDSNHLMGVDIIKIRVDDQLGTSSKMPEDIYRSIIKKSHELGYKVVSHMYYLEDARNLLHAGTDMLAHSIRDHKVDEAFIKLAKEKKASYCPTLTRELSTYVYEDTASFFSDPFFTREYNFQTIQPLLESSKQLEQKRSRSAKIYKRQLPVAMANLKILHDSGVPIVLGTDSGVPTRFMGYFEHLEMEMMAQAGLAPMQIILSATKNAAQHLGLKDLGTISPGHWADFLVLDANPLTDIRNVRQINKVYINGSQVKR